jgi:hypothetical protein
MKKKETVNGTVAQDGPTAITTTVRIRVPGWDFALVAVLFALSALIFVRNQIIENF